MRRLLQRGAIREHCRVRGDRGSVRFCNTWPYSVRGHGWGSASLGGGIGAAGTAEPSREMPGNDGLSEPGSGDGSGGGSRRGDGSSGSDDASSRTLSLMIFTPLAAGCCGIASAADRCK